MMMRDAGLMRRELTPLGRRHDRQKEVPPYVVFSWDRPDPAG
jgi:hypothetical protein